MMASQSFAMQKQCVARPAGLSRQTSSLSSTKFISRPARVAVPKSRVVKAQIAQELYQVADAASFISGTAATVFAITLVGLSIGFVLLRFEALVEEGKIV